MSRTYMRKAERDQPRPATAASRPADSERDVVRPLAVVRGVQDERSYLYQIIQTISAGPDLDTILHGVVRLVTEASGCHACFIYFLQDGSLELRAASETYRHLEGKVTIPFGEGLTGWVAKTRRSAHIRQNALEDPRVRRAYFPELGDDVYQSLVSVPIFARGGDVLGVITLHAEAPHEFGRDDVDFLEHTASLVAGAVENARLYEEATRRVRALTDLSRLLEKIAAARSADQVLTIVTTGSRDLTGAARVEVYLLQPDHRLALAAADPSRKERRAVDATRLLADALQPSSPETAARVAEELWGTTEGVPLVAPMTLGDEQVGLIAALLERPATEAPRLIAAVASHAAMALRQHQLIEALKEESLTKDLFDALSRTPQRIDEVRALAARLGVDLDASNLVVHLAPREGTPPERHPWREVLQFIASRIAGQIRGAAFEHRERWSRGLLPLGDRSAEEVIEIVRRAEAEVRGSAAPVVSIGISYPCQRPEDFPRAFREAEAAADVGPLVRGGPVAWFDEIGPYRYVLESDGGRDRYQERIEGIVQYDRRRRTRLLETLEAYLDRRGNAVTTARSLFIHPNTLRQRLERIERLTGLVLDREDWLSLGIAVKATKLRQLRTRTEGGRDG